MRTDNGTPDRSASRAVDKEPAADRTADSAFSILAAEVALLQARVDSLQAEVARLSH